MPSVAVGVGLEFAPERDSQDFDMDRAHTGTGVCNAAFNPANGLVHGNFEEFALGNHVFCSVVVLFRWRDYSKPN